MSQHTILTLDLNNEVPPEARNKFYEELNARKWRKIDNLTTLWYANWNDGVSTEDIINTTKIDVENCATVAKVAHYDAALAICGKPVVWKK